eukprot:TRINITY_DN14804_c0_g1_i1.p1 TRINITY_DN14804_c0_g1~~TRINITY_DN14804_c0_g1_i1.p1  ORF type:complete len:316 (+),score=73.34 TRINITY_DN14804_c0_g1_i1:45-950(+)
MTEVEIKCSSEVAFSELEALVTMPGYVSLELEEEEGTMNVWVVMFSCVEAADTAVFMLLGQKTKNGHILNVKRKEEEDDAGTGDMWEGHRNEHQVRAKISTAGNDWKAFISQEDNKAPESVGLNTLLDQTATQPEKKRRKIYVAPTDPWMSHIPPPPVTLRTPKTFIPVKLNFTSLRHLRDSKQDFYVRQGPGHAFSRVPVTLDEMNNEVREKPEVAPSSLPIAVALTWEHSKPNIAALKKAVSKKATLVKCQVKVAKKLAVMGFKTPEQAARALKALAPLHSRSQIIPEDKIEMFLSGGV